MARQRNTRASAIPPGDNSRQGRDSSHIESSHIVPTRGSLTMPAQQRQSQFWVLNFATVIVENPARFHLALGDAAILVQHAQAFDDAMHRIYNPSQATQPAVKAKNEAMAAAKAVFREYAGRIKDDPSIDIADKINLGMKQTKPTRSTAALRSRPLLSVGIGPPKPGKAGVEGAHRLRFADSKSTTRRRKPEGADYLELRIIISRPVVTDPDTPTSDDVIVRTKKLMRNPSTIKHAAAHAGLTAIYFGRWATESKKNPITSPWSRPVCMTVVGARS